MKLFFAVTLSSVARHALSEYVPKVHEKLDRQGMRWMATDKWHVSVLLVGDEDVETVKAVAGSALVGMKELRLRVGRVNGAPDTKRPGALNLGVDVLSGDLMGIQEALCAATGIESSSYEPHITLSHMKPASTKLGHRLRDFMHSGAVPEDIEWTAESVTLFNTKLDGSYEVISEFPLER